MICQQCMQNKNPKIRKFSGFSVNLLYVMLSVGGGRYAAAVFFENAAEIVAAGYPNALCDP